MVVRLHCLLSRLEFKSWETTGVNTTDSLCSSLQSPEKSTPSLRNGNLSVLKQLWEQPAETPTSLEPKTHSTQQENHQRQPLYPGVNASLESTDSQLVYGTEIQLLSDSDQAMEKWTQRDVPIEKPTVPLNSLKMMFEKGETFHNNVSTNNDLNWCILP